MAKYLNDTGLTYLWGRIKALFVAKDGNKVLSDNNYTNAEKDKLAGIAAGAQVNAIETIKVNNDALTPTAKAVNISVPTKLTDLTNDGNFVTDASYVHTDSNYTAAEKVKLASVETNAQVNTIESIKVNGNAQTISAAKVVDITVPTKTSDISNDSNFVSDASYVHTDNNYTSSDKTKLSNVAAGAQVNVIETVKVNNTALTVANKAVNVVVPTKTSDITNDSDYVVDANYVHTENSYTTTDKNKLSGIAAGAQVNVIEAVKVNGTALTPSSKAVDITVPTTVAQLSDSSDYAKKTDITGMYKYKGSVATAAALPSSGQTTGDVYNIETASAYGGPGMNVAWNGTAWDPLGEIFAIEGITTAEIDTIVAS